MIGEFDLELELESELGKGGPLGRGGGQIFNKCIGSQLTWCGFGFRLKRLKDDQLHEGQPFGWGICGGLEFSQEMERWIVEMRHTSRGMDKSAWLHFESITEYAALRNLLRGLG